MLRLEKLELHGFKSFCDVTEIIFHKGITAIVGPNGCGKSNIVDAIAWVLGEQSARSLRGSRMDDVIFNGSGERKPIGLAEVTLTLIAEADISPAASEVDDIQIGAAPQLMDEPEQNGFDAEAASEISPQPVMAVAATETEPAHLEGAAVVRRKPDPNIAFKRALAARRSIPAIAAGERVTISRRLYRSGESDYLINGHSCRLRDIQDFFAGTGLGRTQYAIIEQGSISQIIASKPQELRLLIEEAAGITKFKSKKHLAELKLEASRQNLARLNDIMTEVESQLSSLRKQAAKARRYSRLREQLRHYKRQLFASEYKKICSLLERAETELKEAGAFEQELANAVSAREGELKKLQENIRAKEAQLERRRTQVVNLEIERDRMRSQIDYQSRQQVETSERISDLNREIRAMDERAELIERETARRRQDLNAINEELVLGERELGDCELAYRTLLDKLVKLEQELDAKRTQLVSEAGKTEKLRFIKQQLEENLKYLAQQRQKLKNEAARAEERRLHFEKESKRLLQEVESQAETLRELEAEHQSVVGNLEETVQSAEAQKAEFDEATREAARAEDRLAALVKLDGEHAYFAESVQKLFVDKKAVKEHRLLGTLADFLRVPTQYEMMVERALGERLQAVIVPSIKDALGAAHWLAERELGSVAFLILGDGNADLDTPPLTESNRDVALFIEALGMDKRLERVFRRGLPDIASARIAPDIDAALKSSSRDPNCLFVTLNGEIVRAESLIVTCAGSSSKTSVLLLKREIKELTSRAALLRERSDESCAVAASIRERVLELEETRSRLSSQIREEEKALRMREDEKREFDRELARAEQHIRVVQSETGAAEQEETEKRDRYNETSKELASAQHSEAGVKSKVENLRREIDETKSAVEKEWESLGHKRADRAGKIERRRAAANDLKRLEEEAADTANNRERKRFELAQYQQRTVELKDNVAETEAALHNKEIDFAKLKESEGQLEMELQQGRAEWEHVAAELERMRGKKDEDRERAVALEIERSRLTSDLEHVERTWYRELGEKPDPQSMAEPEVSEAEAVENVEQLILKLEEIGSVNMQAAEQTEEVENRQIFLRSQYGDLIASIETAEEAIKELKKRSRGRMREAFEHINEHFKDLFVEMFGGGQGAMILIDENDILESGVEIIAQPPGKRLQNVKLLSGGEKALAGLALVLAIFRFRPSPFCVLDEVDAPLDDVNIGRVAEKVLEMSGNAQCLVITHSKKTMESASRLYGVTMEEPGVSKMVSVGLE